MMKINEFLRLPELDNIFYTDGLNIGSKFLYGKRVISQKQNKKEGDEISYYIIINKTESGVEYTPVFDVLENDKKGENE